jgi:hypothetical protein
MAHARITHATQKPAAFPRTRKARHLFFKPDHPRAIDQHIDYFGGAGGASAAAGDDLCGETLLERLA